ncbi:YbaB/EbfC family nucleoid-associated protein [Nonomuraea cavernae]|uniref:YbaB/EbfC family nucleoid-associated protein n=1 Tax=Nonomuraea cavernae TaxID=2045107 RepID=UPI0033CC9AEE
MNDRYPAEAGHTMQSVFPESRELAAQLVGQGFSGDRSVRVTIGGDGLVELVDMDPRVMRRGSEELAELAAEALRNAQEDWFRRFAQATAPLREERARDIQERLRKSLEQNAQMYAYRTREIQETLAKLSQDR